MTGNLSVSTTSTFTGRITCGDIAPSGTGGIKILKLDGNPAAKIFDTGAAQFYSNVSADGNLTVSGNLTVNGTSNLSPFWVAGKIDGSVAGAVPTILTQRTIRFRNYMRSQDRSARWRL